MESDQTLCTVELRTCVGLLRTNDSCKVNLCTRWKSVRVRYHSSLTPRLAAYLVTYHSGGSSYKAGAFTHIDTRGLLHVHAVLHAHAVLQCA